MTGTALAIKALGKCFGGAVFPLLMYYLLDNVGFSTALSTFGVVAIVARY